jgi:ubiquinone/menaquinone biosynthesis C-methylase UbiE
MDRGTLGTMPRATERDSETYLEFVEGIRVFNTKELMPAMAKRGAAATSDFTDSHGRGFGDIDELKASLGAIPLFATRNRMWRTSQEMAWEQILATYRGREPELLAELDAADRRGPGSVAWDPNFTYPKYFADVDFHIQPGNYHADPLAGYYYHYGTKVLFMGKNDLDDLQREYVGLFPEPADGVVRRVVDLACSIGQSTTALKERFPQAEVWGIDIAAPMARYAHKRAADMGIDVHFAQMLAEKTTFPSGSFDIVYNYILFHEIPSDIAQKVCNEAYRLLRPGGLYVTLDVPNRPFTPTAAVSEFVSNFVTEDNGEPYYTDFMRSDFPSMIRKAGFASFNADVTGHSTAGLAGVPVRVAVR